MGRNIQEELAFAQRYHTTLGGYTTYDYLGMGGYNTAGIKLHVKLPAKMRIVPTLTPPVETPGLWSSSDDRTVLGIATSIALAGSVHSTNTITLDFMVAGGTNGKTYVAYSNNNANARIDFDAEI